MKAKIKLRRGAAASVPTLSTGEIGFSTDTKDIYVGSSSGNAKFLNSSKTVTNVKYDSETGKVIKTIDGTDYDAFDLSELAEHDYPGVYSGYVTKKASGSIVHIEDGADSVPLKTFDFDIEPIQDLHGQASPYPENGGKNKLPLTVDGIKALNTSGTWSGNVYSASGTLKMTILTDNANNVIGINVNGTPTGNTFFNIANLAHDNIPDNFILNGCPAGGVAYSTYQISLNATPGATTEAVDVGSGATVAKTSFPNDMAAIIRIGANYAANNLLFKPMIRLATEADATFAPYSNECPILGYTGANIRVTGKNMLYNLVTGSYTSNGVTLTSNGDGSYTMSGQTSSTVVNVWFMGGYYNDRTSAQRHVLFKFKQGDTITTNCNYYFWKSDFTGNIIAKIVAYGSTQTYTFPYDGCIVGVRFPDATVGTTYSGIFKPILALGINADYEAYKGANYAISWNTEAGTVYKGYAQYLGGGQWDITADNPDTSYIELDGTESWVLLDDGTTQRRFASATIASLGLPTADTTDIEHTQFCSQAVAHSTNNGVWGQFRVVSVIVFNDKTSHFADAAALSAYFAAQKTAGTPVAISYKVATPVTFTVSGPDPLTLLGENYIFNSVGDTDLTYRRDPEVIEEHLTELDKLKEENAEVTREVLSSYPLDTVSNAAVASIPDGADDISVKELTVGIEAKQDLHGYDNPWPPAGENNIFAPETGDVTSGDVTITRSATGVYGASGSVSSVSAVRISNLFTLKANTTYYMKGFWSGLTASDSTCKLDLRKGYYGTDAVMGEFTGGYTPTEDTQVYMFVRIAANYTIPSNVTFKPYVTTNPDLSNWSPYSNICPVYSQAEKNLFDLGSSLDDWYMLAADGTKIISGVISSVASGDIDHDTGTISITSYDPTGYRWGGRELFLKPNTDYSIPVTGFKIVGFSSLAAETTGTTLLTNAGIFNTGSYAHIIASFYPESFVRTGIMVTPADNPDPTFAPYRCVARVDEYGKNLFGFGKTAVDKTTTYRANAVQRLVLTTIHSENSLRFRYNGGNWSTATLELYGFDGTQDYALSWVIENNTTSYTPYLVKDPSLSDSTKLVINIMGGNQGTVVATSNYFDITNIQVELGSTATAYEAYKDRTYFSLAKNVWDEEYRLGTYSISNGEFGPDTTHIACKNPVPVIPGVSYYFDTKGHNINVCWMDEDMGFISNFNNLADVVKLAPANARYLVFNMSQTYGTTYNGDIGVLNAPPVVWGGEIEVVTGKLTVKYGRTNLGGGNWGGSPSNYFYRYIGSSAKPNSMSGCCSVFKPSSEWDVGTAHLSKNTIAVSIGGNILIYAPGFADLTSFSDAMTGQYFVYEYTNPQVFRIDPVDVKTWLAVNNITANTGDIVKLNYRADTGLYVTKKLASLS